MDDRGRRVRSASYADPEPTLDDLEILERADALLVDEAHWNRVATLECPDDLTEWSLYCALRRACVDVLGYYDHRRAALQQVRFAIEEVCPGRRFRHRLTEFNNERSFRDVKSVIRLGGDRIRSRLETGS